MFTLKRADGMHFDFHGWTPMAHRALQFRTEGDARDYARDHKVEAAPDKAVPPPAPGMSEPPNLFGVRKA